jgi:Ca-activated chloride channel family protein
MDAIFRKLERPVLTDVQVQGFETTTEMFPPRIPDLYDGEPIVLAFRTPTIPSKVTLTGVFNSAPWTTTVDVAGRPSRDGLAIYWARQKIASLMDGHGREERDASIRQSVLDVALTHHLVSPYTSLVAIDTEPIRPTDTSLITHAMKTNLPEGQDYQPIIGLPRTATDGRWHLLVGVAMLALASWLWRQRYQIA